jgi:P-type Ca2+ transporter type 2C
MERQPRAPYEAVITWGRGLLILFHGTLVAAVGAVGFWFVYQGDDANLAQARTVTFAITAFSQLFFAVGCRSQRFTMPELGLFSNPYLLGAIFISGFLQLFVMTLPFVQPVFKVTEHAWSDWLLVFMLALTPITIIELGKILRARFRFHTGGRNASPRNRLQRRS